MFSGLLQVEKRRLGSVDKYNPQNEKGALENLHITMRNLVFRQLFQPARAIFHHTDDSTEVFRLVKVLLERDSFLLQVTRAKLVKRAENESLDFNVIPVLARRNGD